MQYQIVSDREVAGRKKGEVVSGDDLTGCNIEALIAGGHLSPVKAKAVKADQPEE